MLRASPSPTGALPAFAWTMDDFRAAPDAPLPCSDPWEIDLEAPHAPEPPNAGDAGAWIWDEPSPLMARQDAAPFDAAPDWALFVDLPAFDPRVGRKTFFLPPPSPCGGEPGGQARPLAGGPA
jgi:hypothetical protein